MNENVFALVTGGSSGMGLEYVKQLAQKGYNVIIVALFQNETDQVAQEMQRQFPKQKFISIGIDLSKTDSAKNIETRLNIIDPTIEVEVLINNAGVLYAKHFVNMTESQVGNIIMIHNYTLSMLCNIFVPKMVARGKGYILNISSLAAWLPYPFISTYAATKAYTKAFSRALRTELRGSGVSVSSIYFGAVSTNLYKLSPSLRKLAINLSVMLTSESAAKKALRLMFRRGSGSVPGFINKFFLCIVPLIPHCLISKIEKWASKKWNLK